jgi:hypothetical protein
MKRTKKQPKRTDPVQALFPEVGMTTVPLEEVLANLRVSEREGDALKKGLLAEINRLCGDDAGEETSWLFAG